MSPQKRTHENNNTGYYLVCCCTSERSVSKANTLVSGIVYRVESLKPGETVDEVETLARGRTDIGNDEEDSIGIATNSRVQSSL